MRLVAQLALFACGITLTSVEPAHAQSETGLPVAALTVDQAHPGASLYGLDEVGRVDQPAYGGAPISSIRLLDVRPKADYDAGHIPNAVWVDVKRAREIAARPGGLTDLDAWVEWTIPLALRPDLVVAIMDGDRQLEAARVWWLLRYLGVPKVGLIDGNFGLWQMQRRPVTPDVPDIAPNPYPVDFQTDRLATRETVLASLHRHDARIVDARTVAEWAGTKLLAQRGGHMPTACRLEWLDFVDKYGRFLNQPRIEAKITAAGIRPGERIVTHCQGGGRASVDAFVFERLGYATRNFYLGWSDWGNATETPITTDETSAPAPATEVAASKPSASAEAAPARAAPPPAAQPFVAEYYYKCRWGHSNEFLALFQKNHLPILRERMKQGSILKVTMTKPRIHENEFGRWDYRVTIEFRDAAAAFDPATDEAIKARLFPDQATYRLEEQRRFELLDAHWDVPIDAVDLDKPVMVP